MELLRKLGKSLILGSLMGIFIALFTRYFFPGLIDRLENQTYYLRNVWKFQDQSTAPDGSIKELENDPGIYIVDIDDRSQHKLGLYWSWDRSYHARLVDSLNLHHPAAILFDINFYDPEDSVLRARQDNLLSRAGDMSTEERSRILGSINYDNQFVEATRRAGNVYQGVRLSDEHDYPSHALSGVRHRAEMSWHDSLNPASCIELPPEQRKAVDNSKTIIDGVFPPLAAAAAGIGHLDVLRNDDGYVRSIPLLLGFGKNKPVYLPASMRVVADLFGTPNTEIFVEPGRYIDIGSPLKISKDSSGHIIPSYPTLSSSQLKAIFDAAPQILSLQPGGKKCEVSPLLSIGKDSQGLSYLSMNCGDFPAEAVALFPSVDFAKILALPVGETVALDSVTSFTRESDVDWVFRAPWGYTEWYLSETDVRLLSQIDWKEFDLVAPGKSRLVFSSFWARNLNGKLITNIPVLNDAVLRSLLSHTWKEIEALPPGSRLDIGEHVRVPLMPDNRHIVTYAGKSKFPFKYYSYYDIFENRIQGELEGKIFIVGSSAPSMFDLVSAPVGNPFPGVEVHATLMNSFMNNTFVTRLPVWQDFVILIAIGFMVGVISYFFAPLIGAIVTVVMVLVWFLVAMTLFTSDNLWIEIARPVITIILTFTAVMGYRYMTEEKDRKFIQSTFKQYLSPELIEQMYKSKQMPTLGGSEGVLSAYFTDIQGFSTFSEKLGSPTRLVELLNEYLTAMTDALMEHMGTLDKYEGDAIIAFFGAPMPMADHAKQACLTALEMQRKLGDLRAKWRSEGDKWPDIVHNMRMRIGINTGPIVTGNMGSKMRMNYTMMGDAVNLAARLESAAKQYGVYTMISEATLNEVREFFEYRQLDKITVVGKSEPVVVYELIAEKGQLDADALQLLALYNEGLSLFYAQKWDASIAVMLEAEKLEPNKAVSSKGISPSKEIRLRAEKYRLNPPGSDWDGVWNLSEK